MVLPLLFAGTPEVAVPSLRLLAQDTENFEIRAVLTRPDAPTGRGRKLVPSPVKQAALELGLEVWESNPSEEESFIEQIKNSGVKAAAVVAYGKILRESVLNAVPLGWYNLHFSLLPQWRGAAPVQRAIWAGDEITGATVFRITKGMDSGPILAQYTTEIGKHETSGELLNRLSIDGAPLLSASLSAVESGSANPVEQNPGSYDVAQKITVDDAHIRFDVPAFVADRQIRACTPNPGAWCNIVAKQDYDLNQDLSSDSKSDSKSDSLPIKLHVLKCALANSEDLISRNINNLLPGKLFVDKHHVWVGTSNGVLELQEVKAQGKKAMKAADWARGAHLSDNSYCE